MKLVAPLVLDRPEECEEPWFEPLLFNLATNVRTRPLRHPWVEVKAGSPLGMATADDFDVVVRLASIILMQKRAGLTAPLRDVPFHPYSFIGAADDKPPSGRQYALFQEKLERLRTTVIALRRTGETFSWLSHYETLAVLGDDASVAVTARLSDYVWRRVAIDEAVVALDPAHFSLSGGWSRWLHLVACQAAPAAIPEAVLRERAAYTGTPEKLRSDIRKATVPGYALDFRHDRQGQPYTLHIDPA